MTGVAAIRGDDYFNLLTKLGNAGSDKSMSTGFSAGPELTHQQAEQLYEAESLAARIVDRPVDDATREPFTLAGADKAFDWAGLASELEDHDVVNSLADAWRWARLYGGALAILNVEDGCKPHEKLDLSRAKKLRSIEVVEAPYATPASHISDLRNRGFARPRAYTISTYGSNVGQIHHSRVIRFDAYKLPPNRMLRRYGWAPSVLNRVWRELRRLGSSMGYAENILHELSVMVLRMKGFREMAAGDERSKEELGKAMHAMRMAVDILHAMVLDADDEYVESTRSVAGLDALLGRFVDAMVRATDMPRTILLGEQPSGLNADAAAEVRGWYDHVATQQQKVLTPALSRVVDVILRLRGNRGAQVPTSWTIEYAPLWQPSEKEQAETRAMNAQADIAYVDRGVLSSDEVRGRLRAAGELTGAAPLLEEDEYGT